MLAVDTSAPPRFTVALASAGRSGDVGQWSGTPYALTQGLRATGATVVALDVVVPGPLQTLLDRRLELRHAMTRPLSALASQRLRRLPVDGICQLGSEFQLDTKLPLVTFDDMTVAQATSAGWDATETAGSRLLTRWRERQGNLYRSATVCGAFSRWTAASIVEDYGIDPARVEVFGWGRNHEPAANGERDWQQPRFLFVGVDWQRKNGDAVVRAFGRLRESVPDARLDVVGGHPPIDAQGVVGHGVLELRRPEERARLSALFAAATCFVMPSWNEPGGIAYAEAAAAGLPLIGTTAGGASEMVRPECGFVVDPRDEQALLTAMRTLSDPEVAAATGRAARARAELFTWPAVAERVLRALGAPEWKGRPWSPFLGEG
ncbi:glycosyltransferase family 4 protein [Conexibacter woesei]|uniref:Glycosyl transferase group 1 n=1 Tax=Conexibacter woesei (strain DSM 14684 / CCUG 47730 / CIP 108061 / JCM 11494 / NBRC 100937 / ID131577) TaxID=469383 RepID=D3FFC4_CONWI|nr:glycosyltransferase family 4 protein [Conexibacter woesei]ADB53717.1 glycosyl transferase group 1 [Conexibacter woesei DSM 14684]